MGALLALRDVDARYGQVQALRGVSLTVDEGEIVAILGANGAGKTTTLRADLRHRAAERASSSSPARSLGRRGPEATARLGVAHVPEGRGTFAELTVWENLRLGAHVRRGSLRDDFRARRSSTSRGSSDGARQQAGHAVGRRAADARARASA